MKLSKLEADLIGDMWQDHHYLYEVFEFVRLHHGNDPEVVRRVGRDLVASWIDRGWIDVVTAPPFDVDGSVPPKVSEILSRIDAAPLLDCQFDGADLWLALTDKAVVDVPWLSTREGHEYS